MCRFDRPQVFCPLKSKETKIKPELIAPYTKQMAPPVTSVTSGKLSERLGGLTVQQ